MGALLPTPFGVFGFAPSLGFFPCHTAEVGPPRPRLCPHVLGDGVGLLSDRGQDTASQLALLLATNPQALEISTPPTPRLTLGQPPPYYFSIPRQGARGGALWSRSEEEGSRGVP